MTQVAIKRDDCMHLIEKISCLILKLFVHFKDFELECQVLGDICE